MDMLSVVRAAVTNVPASRLKQIAVGANVPYMTLRKVAHGPTRNPRYETVERIARFLEQESAAVPHQ